MKQILAVLLLASCSWAVTNCDGAGNCYVRAGATGTNSGADWTNACPSLTTTACSVTTSRPATPITIWVATGTYGSTTFSASANGTNVLTIKGATVAAHGTNTGWVNTMSVDKTDGGAQATFGSSINITGNFITVDGSAGNLTNDKTAYGFALLTAVACPNGPSVSIQCSSQHNTAMHIAVDSCGAITSSVNQHAFQVGGGSCNPDGTAITVSHNYMADANEAIDWANFTNSEISYNYMEKAWSNSNNHGDVIGVTDGNGGRNSGMVMKYNVFSNCWGGGSNGTGAVVMLGPAPEINVANNWEIYGNIFQNCPATNGLITSGGNFTISNTGIYNNTSFNSSRFYWGCDVGGGSVCTAASGNVVENNLIVNADGTMTNNGGAALTTDYNTCASVTSACPTQTHGQTYADATGTLTFNSPSTGDFSLLNNPTATGGTGIVQVGLANVDSVTVDRTGTSYAGTNGWARGALVFQGGAAPAASLSTTSLTFNPQPLNTTSAAQNVTFTNTGNATMTVSSVSITGDFADTTNPVTNCGGSLTAGASCTISVTFTPRIAGARTGTLSITDNAAGSPHTVSLTGTGGTPTVSLSVTSLTFAGQNVNTTSAGQSVTLTNTGTAALTITSISDAGTNAADFAESTTCPIGSNIGINSSCTITVTFTPTASGTRTATVSIVDSAADSPQSISLSGAGIQQTKSCQVNSGITLNGGAIIK